MAASYANRCHAYMQLGELKRAHSTSANASLEYARLSGAVLLKQPELIKRVALAGRNCSG